MNPINFAILGLGHIGKVHALAIENASNANLFSVIDSDPKNTEEFENVNVYRSLSDFFSKDQHKTHVVSIATPNGLHAKQAIECLKAGYHVLIEKPLALNTEDARAIIKTAEETNKRAFNMLQLRFSPVVQHVKELINEGFLGDIFMVNTQCYWNRNNAYYSSKPWHGTKAMDGGVLFTQFSHFADILNYLFGNLNVQNSESFNFTHKSSTEFADSGKVNFNSDKIHSGSLIYTTSTYPKNFESTINIIAEKGTIQIKGQYMNEFGYYEVEGLEKLEILVRKNFHQDAIYEVSKALIEKSPSILDAKNSIPVVAFIEKASE